MKTLARLVVPFLLAFLTLPGCTGGKEAVTFNDNIVNAHRRLGISGEAFGKSIGPAISGEKPHLDEARRTYKEAKDTLESIKSESASWKVPSSPAAKTLLDAHNKLMATQETSINEFGSVIKVLEDPKLSPAARRSKVEAMLAKLAPAETAAMEELKTAQQAFARAHNIKLVAKK